MPVHTPSGISVYADEVGPKDRLSRMKGVFSADDHQENGFIQRKGNWSRRRCMACVYACFVAAIVGAVSWQTSGSSSSPRLRKDRMGEALHLIYEQDVSALINSDGKVFIQDVVALPDEVLLLVSLPEGSRLPRKERLSCLFGNDTYTEVTGAELYKSGAATIRCLHPPASFAWRARQVAVEVEGARSFIKPKLTYPKPLNWRYLVYEIWSTADDVVLFAKGLSHSRENLQSFLSIQCVYDARVEVAVTVAVQEVFRCPHPDVSQREGLFGKPVTLKVNQRLVPSVVHYEPDNNVEYHDSDDWSPLTRPGDDVHGPRTKVIDRFFMGEYRLPDALVDEEERQIFEREDPLESHIDLHAEKSLLCSCNLIWNGAKFLKEWVMYHSWLGVDKFFLYDNNSDDDIEETVRGLVSRNFQITRITWPWIKTQEAGFGHCALLAQRECSWMMFTDIDEYAFPKHWLHRSLGDMDSLDVAKSRTPAGGRQAGIVEFVGGRRISDSMADHLWANDGQAPLPALIMHLTKPVDGNLEVGQISIQCRDFGPSGLTQHPVQGVTVGYTCRAAVPIRHKSIVLLAAIDKTLRNAVHHFDLNPAYRTVKLGIRDVVINHYKYQAWDEFKTKFKRRVSTYVPDWSDTRFSSNKSQDRAPGLGNEAVKPYDWEQRFCEVKDNDLRDYVLRVFRAGEEQVMVWQ